MGKNTIPLPHKCPNCGIEAKTLKEYNDLYGSREENGSIKAQSWCKKCRSKKR